MKRILTFGAILVAMVLSVTIGPSAQAQGPGVTWANYADVTVAASANQLFLPGFQGQLLVVDQSGTAGSDIDITVYFPPGLGPDLATDSTTFHIEAAGIFNATHLFYWNTGDTLRVQTGTNVDYLTVRVFGR